MSKPFAWQGEDEKTPVEVWYTSDGNTYGFEVGEYDVSKPLFIDPEIVSTYFYGNSGIIRINDLVLDDSENVYVVGDAQQTSFSGTTGAYDPSINGYFDIFVAILDPELNNLLAFTYIGGAESTATEYGKGIALHSDGSIYITGTSNSSTYPVTQGAFSTQRTGGQEVVISKLTSDLSTLQRSTYIGGGSSDYVNTVNILNETQVIIGGHSLSSTTPFPTTNGAYLTSNRGTCGYVTIIDNELGSLIASTMIGGGKLGAYDAVTDLVLATNNDIYLTGYTGYTSGFPTTQGAYDQVHNGGGYDAFVSCLSKDLTTLKASTFLGGDNSGGVGTEKGYAISQLTDGRIIVVGDTPATNFPVTVGAIQVSYGGGQTDGFAAIFTPDLGTLTASTYMGGTTSDSVRSVISDHTGMVYLAGNTNSTDFQLTPDAFDTSLQGYEGFFDQY